jgi:hypothetical protein
MIWRVRCANAVASAGTRAMAPPSTRSCATRIVASEACRCLKAELGRATRFSSLVAAPGHGGLISDPWPCRATLAHENGSASGPLGRPRLRGGGERRVGRISDLRVC